MQLTTKETEMTAQALGFWANWIETGNILMSAKDAEAAKRPFKALDAHQMEKVLELRKLSQKILHAQAGFNDEDYWKLVDR